MAVKSYIDASQTINDRWRKELSLKVYGYETYGYGNRYIKELK